MHPALRLLIRRKLRGTLRKQLRRMRRPSGWLFGLLGLGLIGVWLFALAVPMTMAHGVDSEPARLRVAVQAGCLLLSVLTLAGAFAHRGLYLPREEIELLFASPLSRADIVRYRLVVGLGRASFGALVLALISIRHMPAPALAVLGVFVAAQTLPLLGQGLSILLGDAENRLSARLARFPVRWLQIAAGLLVVLFIAGLAADWRGLFRRLDLPLGRGTLLEQPWLEWISAPFLPWARTITARSFGEFAPWFALCVAVWIGLFALVARLPIDYRELSLATSADVARRLRRRRRGGGGASATEVASRSAGRRVPWVFGHGPAGAIAWRKSCSILRKARGTILTSLLIVGGLTIASLAIDRGGSTGGLPGALLIAGVGTLYLCAGLRFDFREDLEAMESLKSWPVPGWKAFVATLLPEVGLVSALLAAAILARGAALGSLEPEVLLVIVFVPVVVLLWVAIDNAVYLYLPVRFTPGMEGALHHTGRAMALMFLRLLAFAVVVTGSIAALGARFLLRDVLGTGEQAARAVGLGLFALVLTAEIVGVVAAGGYFFRRFDVARDRG